MSTTAMAENQGDPRELIPLSDAERECGEKLGMSPKAFRHALAENVRGAGGIPWIATETAVGMYRSDLDEFVRGANRPGQEKKR